MPKLTVDQYMQALKHPLKSEIAAVREIVLGADAQITEGIKWNAPSFSYQGDDRVTMRLQPKDRLELIFHRGAKVKDTTGFVFEDATGLMKWLAPDRAVVPLADRADVEAKRAALAELVRAWIKATV